MASTAVLYDLIARDSASRVFGRVGKAADGMGSKMAKVGKAAVALGAGLAAVGAGAAEAADKAAEFQTSMVRIQTQAGASAKDVKTLTKQVIALAPSTQQGPQALSEALYHLKAVGQDNVTAMKSLRVASDLAAVGGADLEDTTNALAGAWRTGIKGAGSFSEAAKTVSAVLGAGNITVEQFNDALGTGILPSAKTFGLSLNQVGAALALFTDEGVPANSAATRLRMSFSLLGAPSMAAEKQLKKIGLTGLQLADAMRGKDGIIGAIQLLKDHLDASGLSASQQSQILSRAFGGGKSSSAILSLVNNLDVLKLKQDQVNKTTSHFGEAVKTQRQTAEAQWKILSSNLQTITIRLGTKLLPPITNFVKYINTTAIPEAGRFSHALTSLIPLDRIKSDAKTAAGVISGFLDQVGATDALSHAKSALSDKLGLSKAKTASKSKPYKPQPTDSPHAGSGKTAPYNLPVGPPLQNKQPKSLPLPHGAAGAVAPTVKATPLPVLPHGGSGQVAPLVAPPKAPKKQLSAAQKQGRQLAKTITAAASAIDWNKLGSSLGKGLGKAIGWVAAHGSDLGDKIAAAIGGIDWVNVGKTIGAIAIPALIGFVDNLFAPLFTVDFWKKHWLDTIIAVISVVPVGKLAGAAGKLLSKIPWGKLGELLGKLLSKVPWGKSLDVAKWVGRAFATAWTHVSSWFGGLKDGIAEQFPKIAGWISDQVVLLPVRIGDLGRLLLKKGRELVDGFGKAIVDHVPGLGSKFVRAVVKVFTRFTFYQTGINLIEGLYNGIASKVSGGYDWVKKHLVDPVVNWVKSLFGVHSPSTVFAEIGGWLVSGLLNGISAGAKGLGGWISAHLVTPVTSRFSKAGSWLISKGSAVVSGLKNGVVSGAKGLAGWITSHVVTPVTSRFVKAASWLVSRGSQVVSGLKSGVVSGAKGIASWAFTHVAQPLTSRFSAARTWLVGRGSQLISGLKSGISGAIKGIGSWVKGHIVDPVVGAVKKYFGIHSPSTVFASLGGHLVSGLIKGLATANGPAIVNRIFGSMPKALSAIVSKGLVHITSLPGKALSALSGLGGSFLSLLGLGGGSGTSGSNQKLGKTLLLASGWSSAQWPALKALWNQESGWNANAVNPSSGAYGIPQALGHGHVYDLGDAPAQIKWGLGYIRSRYGSPAAAEAHELKYHWYDQGGLANNKGLMVKNTNRPERVLSPRQTVAFERLVDLLEAMNTGGGGERPVKVEIHFNDEALKNLIDVRVDCGLDELGTALGVAG